jgi:assimilatory nitrate reductase electron transfer subunit
MTSRRLVVVGNGMAGCRFVQEVLARDPGRRLAITVIGDEPGGAYNRLQLSNVLAGVVGVDSIELAGEQWYAARGVTLRTGVAVARIDRPGRRLRLDDGGTLPYDILVLATGSSPVLPPVAGLLRGDGQLLPGAVAFRTLKDCLAITGLAADAGSAVVLGAGVLGLETARGLAGHGLPVTLVQRGPRLMERQLDADASRVLTRTVRSLGVRLRPGAGVRAVLGDTRLSGVALDDGSTLDADLLVLCCGVRPRVELAREAGLTVAAGVVVDDQLRSSDPRVFAVGECAEHRGRTHGLVAPCWEQARVAAQVIAGPEEAVSYRGSVTVTRLKAAGIELASLGEAAADDEDASGDPGDVEVIRFSDSSRGIYQKLVVRDGRLTGAILLGDTRTVGTITQLFDRGAALPADRSCLLMVRRDSPTTVAQSPTALPGRTTICQCNGITKAGICAAWQDGARDVAEISARTRAMTGCGTCRDAVEGIVAWLAAADTEPSVSA